MFKNKIKLIVNKINILEITTVYSQFKDTFEMSIANITGVIKNEEFTSTGMKRLHSFILSFCQKYLDHKNTSLNLFSKGGSYISLGKFKKSGNSTREYDSNFLRLYI